MPRVSLSQTNFTAGEISPRLIGRVDVDRYANAAALIANAYPVVQGGAKRRPGTRYVATTKTSAKKSRLIPFVYSRDDAYVLEFGDLYARVYKNGAYTGAEIVTPYTEAMLADIDFAQGADTMFLAHPDVPIQRLRRFSDTSWDLSAAPFTTLPFGEVGHVPATTLSLSATTVGTGRTATAGAAAFLPSDVGRQIIAGAGAATITAYTSTTQVTITITIPFAALSFASGAWSIDSSPQALLKPSAKEPVASIVDLFGSTTRAATLTLTAKTGAITVTASAGVFVPGDVGKTLYADSGVAAITGYTSSTEVSATTSSDFASTSYGQGGWGITESTFRAEDVGSYVRLDGGLLKITSVPSASQAKAQIINALTSTVTAPALGWSLEQPVWSAAYGYPRTVTLHEQRLVVAGTAKFPQTIWGSRIAEYLDFTIGTADDEAYSFTISNDEVNPISYLASLRNLIVHTYGGEFSLQGGIEKPITPTNVRIRAETPHGSRGVRPVLIGKECIFVQRAGRKVRAMGYRFDVDGYGAPDLTVLAEHITDGGITALAYQQEPDALMWAVRADGTLLSCTLDRDQQVLGWARHYTDGAIESVATIPVGDREETWLIVRRTVNGATVRYVERMDTTFQPRAPGAVTGYPPYAEVQTWGSTVDCALSFDYSPAQTGVSGLSHLEGKSVAVVADGAYMGLFTVTAGAITLPRAASRVLVGLPFTTTVTLLNPEIAGGTGTAQGNSMRTSELTLRLLDTIGAKVRDDEGNEQEIPFRRFGTGVLDQPPEPTTGNVRVEVLGWARGRNVLSVIQDQPLPFHLLAVIRKFQVNDG